MGNHSVLNCENGLTPASIASCICQLQSKLANWIEPLLACSRSFACELRRSHAQGFLRLPIFHSRFFLKMQQ
ncbi:hypothetical protein WJ08_10300 [Burkholderia vietnamiensis]|nr:hypothetical protein WJ08_10300 [Burkholderia vietnamiensis]KVF36336.1 hypothetical protein WJ10_28010 [Burkholderia vietnamiensis]